MPHTNVVTRDDPKGTRVQGQEVSAIKDDVTPATSLEVHLLTIAMQEIIIVEGASRGMKKLSVMSHPDVQVIDFRVYHNGTSVQAALDVRILRIVQLRSLREVLFDHAKGLLDALSSRESMNALEKRRAVDDPRASLQSILRGTRI